MAYHLDPMVVVCNTYELGTFQPNTSFLLLNETTTKIFMDDCLFLNQVYEKCVRESLVKLYNWSIYACYIKKNLKSNVLTFVV